VVRDIQALRSFLKPTSDSSPAMMPSSHSGLVGTGVALDVALDEKQLGAIFKGKQMLDRGVP
jgi:hypothetical protein